jgi:hypothetical protein
MNRLINLELFRRFWLRYPTRLPWVNSDAVSRKSFRSEISETMPQKSGGIDGELTIRKFRIVALGAALGFRSYLPRWILS